MDCTRCFLSTATANGHNTTQHDVKTAFLNCQLPHGIHVAVIPPKHLREYQHSDGTRGKAPKKDGRRGGPILWHLRKALYGLPQSMLLYIEWFSTILRADCGMGNLVSEPCLWVKHYKDASGKQQTVSLLHWVDDILISDTAAPFSHCPCILFYCLFLASFSSFA